MLLVSENYKDNSIDYKSERNVTKHCLNIEFVILF